MANGKTRKKTLYHLEDGDDMVQGTEKILEHATAYYKGLFGPGEGDRISLDDENMRGIGFYLILTKRILTKGFLRMRLRKLLTIWMLTEHLDLMVYQ